MRRSVVSCLVLCGLCITLPCSGASVAVNGQVRPRAEVRDPVGQGHDVSTSMRVRAGLRADLEKNVSVKVQFQDVRLWGEEANTLGDFNADNLDLHQGYAELGALGGGKSSLRVGRQEIGLGGTAPDRHRGLGPTGQGFRRRSADGGGGKAPN